MTSPFDITNKPAAIPLEIYRGDTFEFVFTLREDGALMDISADTFKLRIQNAATGEEILTLESGDGIENVLEGVGLGTITAVQTAAMATDIKMIYDLQWTRSDSSVGTVARGPVYVQKDITPP
jgi:hypothetical protein